MARTGRRVGNSGSREAILAAARESFANEGYDGASVRGIAAAAGVDPALVRHYFGDKEHLFVEAVGLPFDPALVVPTVLAGDPARVGERLTRFFLETWDRPDAPFVAVLRSVSTNDQAAAMLRQFIAREMLAQIASTLELDRPQLRTALAASQLVGVAMMRYVVKLEPIASMECEALVELVWPSVQQNLSAD